METKRVAAVLFTAVLIVLGIDLPCFAGTDWQTDGVRVSMGTTSQFQPSIANDGTGNVIVGWYEEDTKVYAQKLDSAGNRLWGSNGILISLSSQITGDNQSWCAADSASAYFIWPNASSDLFIQRLDPAGNTQWDTGGLYVANLAFHPSVITDPSGNAFFVWTPGSYIYGQKMDVNSNELWYPGGVTLCADVIVEGSLQIASSTSGGAVLAWKSSNKKIFVQKANSAGNRQWGSNGIQITNDAFGEVGLISDGAGGALVVWNTFSNPHVVAQHVLYDGTLAWPPKEICSGDSRDPRIVADGTGGAIIAWNDQRNYSHYDIYAQKIDASGNSLWANDGVLICGAAGDQSCVGIVSDGSGGAIIAFSHDSNNLFCQAVNSYGQILWGADGLPVRSGTANLPVITAGSNHSAVCSWADAGVSPCHIYAQHISLQTPTPSSTPTATPTRTRTPTPSPTSTQSPTPTPTNTPAIYVNAVDPNHQTVDKPAAVRIIGRNFTSVPSVKLIKSGRPEVVASDVVVKSNVLVTCVFDLTGVLEGVYGVWVDRNGAVAGLDNAFFVLKPDAAATDWVAADMGACDTPAVSGFQHGVFVGDGDNNSLQEVFVTNRNAKITKFGWLGSAWSKAALPPAPSGENYNDVLVADLDRDQARELYAAAQDNHVYQFKGTEWTKTDLGVGGGKITALAAGDGDNDGELELYAACEDGHAYQFDYNGAWTRTDIGSQSSALIAVAVGDGNNDGEFEVYAAGQDHTVYEFKKTTAWSDNSIGSGGGAMYGLAVADADHDGGAEVYGANEDHKVYQFKKTAATWGRQVIGEGGGVLFKLAASDGDNAGSDKLYCACGDSHIYMLRHENGQWLQSDLGSAGTPLYGLAVGDGDNDDRFEVYAIGDNSHVYQFKYAYATPTPNPTLTTTPTPVAEQVPGSSFKVLSNQINPNRGGCARIRWSQPQSGPATIVVYNLLGDKVAVLADGRDYTVGQFHELTWDGRASNGAVAGSGIYIISFQAGSYQTRGKVAVVK